MLIKLSARALVVGALIAAVVSAPAGAETTPAAPARHLMIVGDSISAPQRYALEADRDHLKAWWSYVLDGLGSGWTYTLSAEVGSGMLNRGNAHATDVNDPGTPSTRCVGTSFGERLKAVRDARPTVLIVAGGRNDFKKCVQNQIRRASESETQAAISTYLRQLAQVAKSIGLDRKSIYVMTPWGVTFEQERDVVTYAMERGAKANGFSYVPLPVLTQRDTSDGTHPTAAGSKALAQYVLNASDLSRFATGAPKPRPKAIQPSCVGYKACRSLYGTIDYQRVRTTSFWSQNPSRRSTNYVAYRLTHEGRRTARIPGKTAVAWRDGARKAGVPITGRPKVGSVAWWPVDPVDGSSGGHVAYVTQVAAGSVTVTEVRAGNRYAVTRYSGSAYPRGFLHFPRSNGSPTGQVSIRAGKRAKSLRLTGFVTDPSRYGTPVPLIVKVTKGHRTVVLKPRQRSRYDLRLNVRSSSLPAGKVTVRVYARNVVGGGKKRVLVGQQTVTLRAR